MKWKLATLVSTCAFFLLLLGILVSSFVRNAFGIRSLDSQSVITEVKQLNQLVTVKYSIQRVVGLREPKVPFGEESILIMVQGEALAGVDLSTLTPADIHYTGKQSVLVALPPAKLFQVFLDEKQTKVWDREVTWWTPWIPPDPDLEHKARLEALADVRSAAMNMGIIDQAQKNAETAIRGLLGGLGLQTTFKTRSLD